MLAAAHGAALMRARCFGGGCGERVAIMARRLRYDAAQQTAQCGPHYGNFSLPSRRGEKCLRMLRGSGPVTARAHIRCRPFSRQADADEARRRLGGEVLRAGRSDAAGLTFFRRAG
jgi:hypothetical protein